MSRRFSLAIASAALVAGLVAVLVALGGSPGSTRAAPNAARDASEPLACRFARNDTAAFAFESSATLDGGSAGDHLRGVLSWVVVDEATAERPALLRASLSEVVVDQALSEERARADELEDGPFYLRVDARCRFTDLGFAPRWSGASRRLVTTLLQSYEVVLAGDGDARWEADQRDGIGDYTAQYAMERSERGSIRVRRTKPHYRLDREAVRMGVRVQLLGAEAEARFDPERPGWAREVTGRERVRFHVPGEGPQAFVHRFSIAREDARYAAVSDALSLRDADFSDALEADPHAPSPSIDPALRAVDHDTALASFLAYFADGRRDGVFPAARSLAAWLRAHPEGSALLFADLLEGEIDEAAHAALFLALELAGTGESRQVLAGALVDPALSALNRARAASALADHGEPTRETAELLLTQARESGSPMVANVSLLGAGRLAGRTDPSDPLRAELREALHGELARARGEPSEAAVLDALGNSGDDAFAPALDERLSAARPTLRAHAAEALGHLSPEVARPRLLSRLETEESPSVRTAIVRSLRGTQAPGVDLTPAELALAARLLATSETAEARAAVIDWVGRAAHQREARRVLVAHFHAEPDVHLQQRIGAFVTPADLRELAG